VLNESDQDNSLTFEEVQIQCEIMTMREFTTLRARIDDIGRDMQDQQLEIEVL
jgi:hypothetical protein